MVHHGTEGQFVVALDVGADVGPVLTGPLVLKNEENINYQQLKQQLSTLNLKKNDEVICPVFTCTATNIPLLYMNSTI